MEVPMLRKDTPEIRARFWAKVNKHGPIPAHCPELGPCWEWTGARFHDGYGMFSLNVGRRKTQTLRAHRLAYFLSHGQIPDGVLVCHHCDNRACCRPGHFFLGTPADNNADMIAKGRARTPVLGDRAARGERHGSRTKPEGIRRGEHNGQSKLTEVDVHEIRRAYAAKEATYEALAQRFHVSDTLIAQIVLRQAWKHVA
jgi:hypothetical protein